MSSSAPGTTPHYFVPQPSRHPAFAAFGLFFVILGAANWVNGAEWGKRPRPTNGRGAVDVNRSARLAERQADDRG